MRRFALGTWVAALGALVAFQAAGDQTAWQVDKAHTHIGFWVRHMGVSRVHGKLTDYETTIHADSRTGKISWLKAKAKAASIDTGIEARDKHLRGADFLAADKHPWIVLETKSITWKGDAFSGKAKLTLRGVTKEVAFTGSKTEVRKARFQNKASLRVGYEVSAVIDRKDFGLAFNALAEGVAIVSDDVHLVFDAELFLPL